MENYKPRIIIIPAFIAIVMASVLMETTNHADLGTFIFIAIILISGFSIAGVLVSEAFIKLNKNHINHPYIASFTITGLVGAITLYMFFMAIPKEDSLESMVVSYVIYLGVILASVVSGIVIGKFVSLKSQK